MVEIADDLERLLVDVRKTIYENNRFLEKLMDDAEEDEPAMETEIVPVTDEFEEL